MPVQPVGAEPSSIEDALSPPREGSSEFIHLSREEFFRELLRLRDDERERIGHELHDSAGQLLVYLQLSVGRLKTLENAGRDRELLDEIQATARQIAAEIRSLAFLNHPLRMPSEGLPTALRALAEGFGQRTGCRVRFSATGHPDPPHDKRSVALLRIAQEALVNVHRHAKASSVEMTLTARSRVLELAIRDNGIGLPPPEEIVLRGGVGVEGMRFRVEQLGGQFEISSGNPGTRIVARFPRGNGSDRPDDLWLNEMIPNSVSH